MTKKSQFQILSYEVKKSRYTILLIIIFSWFLGYIYSQTLQSIEMREVIIVAKNDRHSNLDIFMDNFLSKNNFKSWENLKKPSLLDNDFFDKNFYTSPSNSKIYFRKTNTEIKFRDTKSLLFDELNSYIFYTSNVAKKFIISSLEEELSKFNELARKFEKTPRVLYEIDLKIYGLESQIAKEKKSDIFQISTNIHHIDNNAARVQILAVFLGSLVSFIGVLIKLRKELSFS